MDELGFQGGRVRGLEKDLSPPSSFLLVAFRGEGLLDLEEELGAGDGGKAKQSALVVQRNYHMYSTELGKGNYAIQQGKGY